MGLFKKKLEKGESKELLERIIANTIKATGKTLDDFIKNLLERLKLPQIPIQLPEVPDFPSLIAKVIIKGISGILKKRLRAFYMLRELSF